MNLQIGLFLLVSAVLFAWIKGGPGERAGSAAIAVTWIGTVAAESLAPPESRAFVFLAFDFALAFALLIVAVRYANFWLGATMMLQAFVLAVHAFHMEDGEWEAGMQRTYVVVLNLASLGLLLAIVTSTIAAWVKRSKAANAAVAASIPASAHPA